MIDLEYNDIDILQGALFADVVIDYCYDFRVQNTMTDYTECIPQTVRFKNPCVDTDYVQFTVAQGVTDVTTYAIGDPELNIGSFSFNTIIAGSVPGTPNFCGDVQVEAFYNGNLIQDTYTSEPLRTDSGSPISTLFLLNN